VILTALFVFAAVGVAQPTVSPVATVFADDRTPIRCRPAPYYVAEQGERVKPERLMVTGSRVPVARDYDADRRPRPPCLLMRYDPPPNPLRTAD
jgi:hypothetical protein